MNTLKQPTRLTGENKQDLASLQSFLTYLVNELNRAEESSTGKNGSFKIVNGKRVYEESSDKTAEQIAESAKNLRSLIVKTADDLGLNITEGDTYVLSYTNQKFEDFESAYVARSEYGEFLENINTQIETSSRGVIESYNYGASIKSNQESINLLQQYTQSMNGQIRRGIVVDPSTQQEVLGIAISQSLQFTGSTKKGDDGYEYYYLSTGQTFGLYTSTGWQFWIDGFKKGWYSSVDGMLHIENVYIEKTLQFGNTAQFVVAPSGIFGIKKITEVTT